MKKKELEEREIKLEAIIQAYHDVIEKFSDSIPISLGPVAQLESVSRALFNAAEVRVGIEELVDMNVKYE